MNNTKDVSAELAFEAEVPETQAVGRIAKLTKLEVRFEVPGVESKRLYANGRMQVRVWVFVEAQDADGNPVPLPYFPDLISTKLIHYHNGKPLERDGYAGKPLPDWNYTTLENKYSHEMPGWVKSASVNEGLSVAQSQSLEFWVSSSLVGQAQIAAEVTLQGKVYRSNNTTNPDGKKINKSVILSAEKKATYRAEQFSWQEEKRGNVGGNSDSISLYHLGLYPGSRQVELLSWESSKYNPNSVYPIDFCRVNPNSPAWAINYLVGVFPSSSHKSVRVNMPQGQYDIEVNQRSGELSLVKGMSGRRAVGFEVRTASFPFVVIDEYGNDHKLSIGIDEHAVKFTLQRG